MLTLSAFPAAIGVLLISLAACSSEVSTAPAPLGIVGLWNQGANLQDSVNNQTHIHTGYFSFTQQGAAGFAGSARQSGFCRNAEQDYTGPLATGVPYAITDGAQQGDRVSFRSELCSYEGTLSADGAHIEGSARCTYTEGGVNFVWTGAWLANRQP